MAKPKRRALTDAERQQRRAKDRQTATAAVEALKSSDGWQAWLRVRRRFHTYTLSNQLLIAMQRPDATRVAGFRAWLALGYCVRRGEKAIRIWTPIPPSKAKLEAWKAAGANAADKPRTLFRLGPVFDRSQVQELPPPAEPLNLEPPFELVTGDSLAWALPVLNEVGASIGSVVTFESLPEELGGFYEPATRRIVVNDCRAVNGRVAVLIHELAHALIRLDRQEDDPALSYAQEELVVESVAYTVCGACGLDVTGAAIPYLASWSERAELATIEKIAKLIDRLAHRIEDPLLTTSEGEQLKSVGAITQAAA